MINIWQCEDDKKKKKKHPSLPPPPDILSRRLPAIGTGPEASLQDRFHCFVIVVVVAVVRDGGNWN